MKIIERFQNLRIKSKLTLTYSLFFVFIFSLSSVLIFFQVRSMIRQQLLSELEKSTLMILDLVETSAQVSIKNHLRATAKANLDLINHQYRQFSKGVISEKEAQSAAEGLLRSQTVGQTGYLYIINSSGTALVHPSEDVKGSSFMEHEFVRSMIREQQGYMEYMWKNPDEPSPQSKAQYFVYFKPWDWIIAATSYRHEFADLVNVDDFRDKILSLRFGESGYSMVLDSKGNAVIHPFIVGSMFGSTGQELHNFIKTVISQKSGQIDYFWKNPGETVPRKKIALYHYIPEYDWIVVSSVYTDELFHALTRFRNFFLAVTLPLMLLIILISDRLGRAISKPVESLTMHLKSCVDEGYRKRINVQGSAEIKQLSDGFNRFMDSLETEIQSRTVAEESLKESQKKLLGIFNSTFHFIFLLDKDGALTDANQSALDFIGMELSAVKGNAFSAAPWWSPSGTEQPEIRDAMHTCLREGFVRLEFEYKRAGKVLVIFDISIKTIRDDAGDIAALLSEARDITERVAAETALKKSEELHRAMLEASPNPVVHYNNQGVPLFINPSFTRAFGWSFEEIRGKRIDFVPQEEAEKTQLTIRKVYEEEPHHVTFQTRRFTKSGRILDVNIGAATFNNNEGDPIGMVVNLTDITQIMQTESELRITRNYIRSIINSMPSVLIGIDAKGFITQWNSEAEKVTGILLNHALQKPLFETLPPLNTMVATLGYPTRSGTVYKKNRVDLELGKQKLTADITLFPISSGVLEGSVIQIDDVTQRMEMEEMMIQSDKMLSIGGLAAGMAHEINNPLAVILQSIQVAQNRLKNDTPKNREIADACGVDIGNMSLYLEKRGIFTMLNSVLTSGKRAAGIVENMLSFARKSDAVKTLHKLDELMDATIELAINDYNLEKKYDFRSITIERIYADSIPPVPCEKSKIQQVFLNILQNGAHAMAESIPHAAGARKPRFTIRISQERYYVSVTIEDNGPGMKEAVKKRLFEPFYTTKEVGAGTGLGLSVSYFIVVEHHQGTLTAESAPGKGTSFTIRLPLKQQTSL